MGVAPAGGDDVLYREELALADGGDDSLVSISAGEFGQLVFGLRGDPNAGDAAEFGEGVETRGTVAGKENVFEPSSAGANGLFNRVEAVKNFHKLSLPMWKRP